MKISLSWLSRTPPLLSAACSFLGGIALGYYSTLPPLIFLALMGITAITVCIFWGTPRERLVLILLFCVFTGAWRCTQVLYDQQSIKQWIGSSIELRGTVSDVPLVSTQTRLLQVQVQQVRIIGSSSWSTAHDEISVQTPGLTIDDPYGPNDGDQVSIRGKLQALSDDRPRTLVATMAFPRMTRLSTTITPFSLLYHVRIYLATLIRQAIAQPEADLLNAILLSLHTPTLKTFTKSFVSPFTSGLPSTLTESFAVTGTIHLLVAGGFKVSLLASIVSGLCRRVLLSSPGQQQPDPHERSWRNYLTSFIVLLSIFSYTLLSGAGPAATRAGIMGSLFVLALFVGRRYNVYNSLAFAALIMSFFSPLLLWDVSFQLSFSGTLGIISFTPFFQRQLRFLERLPLGVFTIEICAVTLAAETTTVPIIAIVFHDISFVAPLANLFTVPLLSIFIFLGLLLCLTGLLSHTLAIAVGWLLWPLLWYVQKIVPLYAALPGSHVFTGTLSAMFGVVYYILLLLIVLLIKNRSSQKQTRQIIPTIHSATLVLSPHSWRMLQIALAALTIFTTASLAFTSQLTARTFITFLSVGPTKQTAKDLEDTSEQIPQGEAILIRTADGKTLLIDGGTDGASLDTTLDQSLPPWQRSLDLVMLTTARNDHLNGLLSTAERYTIRTVVDAGMLHPSTTYARWRRTIDERKSTYLAVRQGQIFSLGKELSIQVLWPGPLLHKSSDEERDNTLIVRITTPFARILLLGAAAQSRYALRGILASIAESDLQAEVVQIVEEIDKPFASELQQVLDKTHATLLTITPAQQRAKSQKHLLPLATTFGPLLAHLPECQAIRTGEVGSLELSSAAHGLAISTE